jgi:hypothetical protein
MSFLEIVDDGYVVDWTHMAMQFIAWARNGLGCSQRMWLIDTDFRLRKWIGEFLI